MRAILLGGAALAAMSAATLALGQAAGEVTIATTGPNPALPDPERGLLPDMVIPRPTGWGDELPTVPEGYAITAMPPTSRSRARCWCCPTATSSWPRDGAAGTRRRCAPRTSLRASSRGWGAARSRAVTA